MRSTLLLIRQGNQTIEELMAPWEKVTRIEGYWGEPVTEKEKKDFIDEQFQIEKELCMDDPEFVSFLESGKEPDFEEYYKDHGEDYNENSWRKDENGIWRHWIEWECNPDGFFDYYVIENSVLKGAIPNLQDLDYDDLLLNGEWISVNGKVYDYIKDLPDDAELVSICYHFCLLPNRPIRWPEEISSS